MTESVARAEDVPDEAWIAARAFIGDHVEVDAITSGIAAAINSWPRAEKSRDESRPCLILPLEMKE